MLRATFGSGNGEGYCRYGPELECQVKREYSPDLSYVEDRSRFFFSAQYIIGDGDDCDLSDHEKTH